MICSPKRKQLTGEKVRPINESAHFSILSSPQSSLLANLQRRLHLQMPSPWEALVFVTKPKVNLSYKLLCAREIRIK